MGQYVFIGRYLPINAAATVVIHFNCRKTRRGPIDEVVSRLNHPCPGEKIDRVRIRMAMVEVDAENISAFHVQGDPITESDGCKSHCGRCRKQPSSFFHLLTRIIVGNDHGAFTEVSVSTGVIAVPMGVQQVFNGFTGDRFQSGFEFGRGQRVSAVHDGYAVVGNQRAYIAADIRARPFGADELQQVNIFVKLLGLDLNFVPVDQPLCPSKRRQKGQRDQHEDGFAHDSLLHIHKISEKCAVEWTGDDANCAFTKESCRTC